MNTMALFFLVVVAVGGVVWVFLYPMLSGDRQVERRRETVTKAGAAAPVRVARGAQKSRREQVEGTLKEIETRNRAKSLSLATKISQAGLSWSKRQYIIISAAMGVGAFLLFVLIDA